jgi:hypothetical protein
MAKLMLAKLIARGMAHDQEKQKDHVHGHDLHPHQDSGQLIPLKHPKSIV